MRVLVLGAYGLIGLEITRRLCTAELDVIGLGRSAALGRRFAPQIRWIGADIATLSTPAAWAPHLVGIDALVNASGALQDGARDNLDALQNVAISALVEACRQAGVRRFVQISAPGAVADAGTAFMRTKAHGDAAVRASALDWVIFKPGLVIAANAYGGTSLLRQLAAVPLVQPVALGNTRLQTVAASDVGEAVLRALSGKVTMQRDYDLVETQAHTLRSILTRLRAWMGLEPARLHIATPLWLAMALARGGDVAGWLGWRTPLRTTALRVLVHDVTGDPAPWTRETGAPLASLEETLRALPATAQERVYARVQLLFPVMLLTLSAFWIASGLIGIWRREAAVAVLAGSALAPLAHVLVIGGALTDLAIGVSLLFRPWTQAAAMAAVLVSIAYLALASMVTPILWADPLGPLVKIFPAAALALAVAALTQTR
jgi:uncharacterized protein YbjT (DUF2867 family)